MRKLILAVALLALTAAPSLATKLDDSTSNSTQAQAQAGGRAAAGGGAKEHASGLAGRL